MKTAKTKFPTLLMLFSVWMFLMACNDDDDPVPMEEDDIVDVVMASSNFTVLESAVVEADLVTTLKGDGPFTVFAPTDAAFTAFLDDTNMTAEDLLGSPSLADVLTYHVLAGEVMATDVSAGEVSTVNGASFYVSEDVEGKLDRKSVV